MQRREQQRRAAAGGPSGGGYLGGGVSGYSPVPQRYDSPAAPVARTASPAQTSVRAPAFKGSGMKLGSKKTRQAELLDALGGDALLSEDMSTPGSPAVSNTPEPVVPPAPKNDRGSLPPVHAERWVVCYLYRCNLASQILSIACMSLFGSISPRRWSAMVA